MRRLQGGFIESYELGRTTAGDSIMLDLGIVINAVDNTKFTDLALVLLAAANECFQIDYGKRLVAPEKIDRYTNCLRYRPQSDGVTESLQQWSGWVTTGNAA